MLFWHGIVFFILIKIANERCLVYLNHILSSGGILVFTSGDEEGEGWSDNSDQQLYHASLSADEYASLPWILI